MSPRRILGAVLFIVGGLLLAAGYHASGAPADQISNAFTGRYTDQTIWYLIAGAAGIIGGAILMVRIASPEH